jgi:protein-L-isoaspartate(D-aspartate) O-methyltransferase
MQSRSWRQRESLTCVWRRPLPTCPGEDFLGPGPWSIAGWPEPYVTTPSADPVYIYTDNVVGIAPERFINNGQPSGHARWLASAKIKNGDHFVHVGTGTGYYTAIIAHLVGRSGRVTGIEFDSELATRAQSRISLSSRSNVQIIQGDGAEVPFDTADVIYVNAGVTRPADIWVDRLSEGGRLILPLTSNKGFRHNDPPEPIEKRGAVFRIERRTPDFLAQWISPIAIIPCESTRDSASEKALAAAFKMAGGRT